VSFKAFKSISILLGAVKARRKSVALLCLHPSCTQPRNALVETRKDSTIPTRWTLRLDEVASVRSGPKYEIEACSFGERSEVPVPREERNTSVDAALGDQRVAETRLAALCEYLRSQTSCPLPIARCDLDQRYF
jgi:hypothetical protein